MEPFGALWGILAELCGLKPYLAPDHPTPLAEPRPPRSPGGTLVKPSCNLALGLVAPWWVEPDLKPPRTPIAEPGGTLVELSWNLTSNHLDHSAALAESGGTLVEPLWNLASNYPRPPRSPRRTWWNPGGTLMKHYPKPPPNHPVALQNLVEAWRNLTSNHPGPPTLAEPGTLPQTTPDHPLQNLVERWWICCRPCRSPCRTWWNPGGTLVEPLWNLSSNHPAPPRSPRRTLPQTLVEPSSNLASNHPLPS